MNVIYIFNYTPETYPQAFKRLQCSVKSLENQDVEIYVLNFSDERLLDSISGIIEIRPAEDYTYYNKARAINFLVRYWLESEYFLMSDVDIIYPKDYVEKMQVIADKYNSCRVIPFIYRTRNEIYSTDLSELYNVSFTDTRNNQSLAAGIGLIHRPAFMEIRGYDEGYVGHGPEDHDFNLRITKKSTLINDYTNIVYHLWHPNLRQDNTKANSERLYDKFNNFYNNKLIIANDKNWGFVSINE
jgi:predicted glycosyltransferase involved in capsule biosynthesis